MLILLATACSSCSSSSETPAGPYFDQVPAYPNARQLCSAQRPLTEGAVTFTAYATPDDLATVVAFYQANHGDAVVQPVGGGVRVRGHQDQMLTVAAVGSEQPTCRVQPSEADHTSLVVSRVIPAK